MLFAWCARTLIQLMNRSRRTRFAYQLLRPLPGTSLLSLFIESSRFNRIGTGQGGRQSFVLFFNFVFHKLSYYEYYSCRLIQHSSYFHSLLCGNFRSNSASPTCKYMLIIPSISIIQIWEKKRKFCHLIKLNMLVIYDHIIDI